MELQLKIDSEKPNDIKLAYEILGSFQEDDIEDSDDQDSEDEFDLEEEKKSVKTKPDKKIKKEDEGSEESFNEDEFD